MEQWTVPVLIFLMGLALGSFLNVVIYRLPRGLSIMMPGSHCPRCGVDIPWKYKIPILSFILLKGKCFSCRQPISWQYPLVELLGGVGTWFLFRAFGLTPSFLFYEGFFLAMVAIAAIDWHQQIVPNAILGVLLVWGVMLNSLFSIFSWAEAGLGALVGVVFMLVVHWMGQWLFRKPALGMGDVKLALVMGFYLGKHTVLYALFASFFLAFLVVAVLMVAGRIKRDAMIPFAPFLALAGLMFLLWGNDFIRWYWSLFM